MWVREYYSLHRATRHYSGYRDWTISDCGLIKGSVVRVWQQHRYHLSTSTLDAILAVLHRYSSIAIDRWSSLWSPSHVSGYTFLNIRKYPGLLNKNRKEKWGFPLFFYMIPALLLLHRHRNPLAPSWEPQRVETVNSTYCAFPKGCENCSEPNPFFLRERAVWRRWDKIAKEPGAEGG